SRSPGGHWVRSDVKCNGKSYDPLRPVQLTITAGTGAWCEFTNRFVFNGRIQLSKVTHGGTATADYQIAGLRHPERAYRQTAPVRRPNHPLRAVGDDTKELPLGTYSIVETGQRFTPNGHWTLDGVLCDGLPVAAAQGRIVIRLSAADPAKDCTFLNTFHT